MNDNWRTRYDAIFRKPTQPFDNPDADVKRGNGEQEKTTRTEERSKEAG